MNSQNQDRRDGGGPARAVLRRFRAGGRQAETGPAAPATQPDRSGPISGRRSDRPSAPAACPSCSSRSGATSRPPRVRPVSPAAGTIPAISRYTWEWLASRFDPDHDGTILRAEFAGPARCLGAAGPRPRRRDRRDRLRLVGAVDLVPDGAAGEPPVRHDRFRRQRPDHGRGVAGVLRRRRPGQGSPHQRRPPRRHVHDRRAVEIRGSPPSPTAWTDSR